jgi:hypothetical protein
MQMIGTPIGVPDLRLDPGWMSVTKDSRLKTKDNILTI